MRLLAAITVLLLTIVLAQPFAALSFKPDVGAGVDAYNEEDYATALKHFRSLAKQGHANAQFWLGAMYRKGDGVTKDDKEAARLYRIAAKQGHVWAQWNLARMYRDGQGVVKDLVMAYVWFKVAFANRMAGPNLHRDILEGRVKARTRLNASQRTLGLELSKLCLKKPANCPKYSDD